MWLRRLDPQVASQEGPAPLGVGQKAVPGILLTPPQGLGVSSLSSLAMYPKRPPERELGAPSSDPDQGVGAPSPAVCWASAALGEGAHFPEGPEA